MRWDVVVVLWGVVLMCVVVVEGQDCTSHTNTVTRPEPCTWVDTAADNTPRDGFLDWLIGGCLATDTGCTPPMYRHVEYEGYDGWYNNFNRPSLGAIDTPLLRLLPPAYHDGSYQPVKRTTNPLDVSDGTMRGPNGMLSKGGRTAFLVFFGQQMVEEILDAQGAGCPPEYFNIDINNTHPYHTAPGLPVMPLLRTRYDMTTGFSPNNPRQQLNEITPYLDGGLVYGTGKGWADVLRTFSNGTLAPDGLLAWHDELGEGFPAGNEERLPLANPPPPTNHSTYVTRGETAKVERFFKLGNPRGNENPFLLTFGIMWYRWHNHIARYLKRKNMNWTDERVFNEARRWVISTYQAVVYYDWLPKYMHQALPAYDGATGYKPTTDPQVSHVFQSAAMRFGHTLVTSGVYLRDKESAGCQPQYFELSPNPSNPRNMGVRTCNSFWRSPELFKRDPDNFERFLMGLSSQSTEKEDNIIVDDLRGRVFGPLEFSRRDLMAVNIQRGRDHGLPDYNTARKHFGLPTLDSLDPAEYRRKTGATMAAGSDVPDDVLAKLRDLYNNDPNTVDIWPGGLLETLNGPGQLFSRVILDQFTRIREADRFWFENLNNEMFNPMEIARLKQMKVIDVVMSVTGLGTDDMQPDPFTAVNPNNAASGSCQSQLSRNTSCTLPGYTTTTTCSYLPPLSDNNTEPCTESMTYDYFRGSELSYILVILVLLLLCAGCPVGIWVWITAKNKRWNLKADIKMEENCTIAMEAVSRWERRMVKVTLVGDRKGRASIKVAEASAGGATLREVDLSVGHVTIKHVQTYTKMIVCVDHHYDLCLRFEDAASAVFFKDKLKTFSEDQKLKLTFVLQNRWTMRSWYTVYEREKELAKFSKLVTNSLNSESRGTGVAVAEKKDQKWLGKVQLTKSELANMLGMSTNDLYFEQMFRSMDADQSGFIEFKELWQMLALMLDGTTEERARLFFDIYDVNGDGQIVKEDLVKINKYFLGDEVNCEQVVEEWLKEVHLPGQGVNFENFKKIFEQHLSGGGTLHNKLSRKSSTFSIYGSIPVQAAADNKVQGLNRTDQTKEYEDAKEDLKDKDQAKDSGAGNIWTQMASWVRNKYQYRFWQVLYTLVMWLVFAERAYYYAVEVEHGGLRRIAGTGVAVTRGAASAMMFTYSSLLVTMCRNLFSALRATPLHRLFPSDYLIEFHRYIGAWALFFTIMHIIGHCINFYHISTQTASDLACIFRDYFRGTHVLPKFHYWCLGTITGLTGVLLTMHTSIIFSFAYLARSHLFKYFWLTHNTYPLFYALMVFHGSGRLVQRPFFHLFFLGPAIMFTIDRLVSMSRNRIKIGIVSVEHLPSSVTRLEIKRPRNFTFQSGQWVRIASLGISTNEYHPFTLSGAPHEENLTLHIRAVGPWTRALSKLYKQYKGDALPEIYLDGPFGEGHQSWGDYEVVILCGGGIGVTPFASILKDIAFKLKNKKHIRTKKVIFLWYTRSQKQFEWMTKILRDVEESDETQRLIRIHIFITQLPNKYDFRTQILHTAERRVQRDRGVSLFTGLRAITHFGRRDFGDVFKSLKARYGSMASVVGVFTCGSPGLVRGVEQGCRDVNRSSEAPHFKHYAQNF